MKLQIDELNASMSKLELDAHAAKKDAQTKYKEEISKLRVQSQLAIDKLDELIAASESSWEGMVAETEKVRDAFVRSFRYFKTQI
jgi:hypothetical protein